ncbi:hypothetical protein ACFL1H_06270 [Nanoarchaeota archaeon]
MEAKKVNAEVVKDEVSSKKRKSPRVKINFNVGSPDLLHKMFAPIKLGMAMFLDLIDLAAGNFYIVNIIWDVIVFFILNKILRQKYLAFIYLAEFFMPFNAGFKINSLIPTATITVLIDIGLMQYKK